MSQRVWSSFAEFSSCAVWGDTMPSRWTWWAFPNGGSFWVAPSVVTTKFKIGRAHV